MARVQRDAPILTVSVAAELAGMHPQTVRQYDRMGLVVARRTRGGGRRYSLNDVDRLIEIQRMSQEEGINLAGIARIMELKRQVESLRAKNAKLERQLRQVCELGEHMREELDRHADLEHRVFAASSDGDVRVAAGIELMRRMLRGYQAQADMDAGQDMVVFNPRSIAIF